MNELIKTGKKRTQLLSVSILLISIYTIYSYHSFLPEIEMAKLIRQIIRFSLTIGLLYMIYKGKKWAKVIGIILFSLAILVALFGILTTEAPLINKAPLFVMVFVYSIAVYHFGISKSYQAFFEYQNEEINHSKYEK